MRSLILNELQKLINRKKFIFIIFALVTILIGIFFRYYREKSILSMMYEKNFLLVTTCIFISDIVSSEYSLNTMENLLSKPIKRGKILFSKYAAALIVTIIFFGSFNLITSMRTHSLKTLILQLLLIISVVSLCFLISTIFKSGVAAIAASIITIFALSAIKDLKITERIAPYILMSFKDIESLLTGNYSIVNSIIVLSMWSVVTYCIAYLIFKTRDITI